LKYNQCRLDCTVFKKQIPV